MKGIRIVFFSFFVFTALISINMIYNLIRIGFGYGRWSVVALAFAYIAIQLIGLISVIIGRSRVIMGIFTILTGIATILSGFMTFAALGAPAPQFLGQLSAISLFASIFLSIAFIALGVLFFIIKPAKMKSSV